MTDALAEFRCAHPREVLALMRSLRDGANPVALSSPCGTTLTATVWTIDDAQQRLALDVERGDLQLPGLVEHNEATAVAYLDAVKLQFDLHDLVLVRSAKATALQGRLPRCVYRFQRRQGFRVRTPERTAAGDAMAPTVPLAAPCAPFAHLRHPSLPDMGVRLRILDLSIGGCALLLPHDVPALPLGAILNGVRLELDGATRLAVTLRLQHASSTRSAPPGLRLGCELLAPDAGTVRALQRHIDQTQKRRRLLALD